MKTALTVSAVLIIFQVNLEADAFYANLLDLGIFQAQAIEKLLGRLPTIILPASVVFRFNRRERLRIAIRLLHYHAGGIRNGWIPDDADAIIPVPQVFHLAGNFYPWDREDCESVAATSARHYTFDKGMTYYHNFRTFGRWHRAPRGGISLPYFHKTSFILRANERSDAF